MTKVEVKEDTDSVRAVLYCTGTWMSTPEIRMALPDEQRSRVNILYCLNKLMIADKAERKTSVAHSSDGKYVYRYRSGVVVH